MGKSYHQHSKMNKKPKSKSKYNNTEEDFGFDIHIKGISNKYYKHKRYD